MGEVEGDAPRWRYRVSVREHVREPLRAARTRLEREEGELHAERVAFERFAEKVATITPSATSGQAATIGQPVVAGGPATVTDDHAGEKRGEVREAYRETVMAVDHYEAVYDEPLLVNVAGELSSDIAESLRDDTGVALTEQLRAMIRAAATDAAERRVEFRTRVDEERESIEDARETLRDIVDALDSSGLPAWYRPAFEDELDELARRRQRRLQSRAAYRRDGHDLCAYIYADEEWTYPVLTAIARLRNSVG